MQSENNKMTEIDALKKQLTEQQAAHDARVRDLQQQLEEAASASASAAAASPRPNKRRRR